MLTLLPEKQLIIIMDPCMESSLLRNQSKAKRKDLPSSHEDNLTTIPGDCSCLPTMMVHLKSFYHTFIMAEVGLGPHN